MYAFLSSLIIDLLVARLHLREDLERYRAKVPYFVITGFIACAYCIPAAGIVALAQLLGYRGTPEVTLTRSWLTIGLLPFGVAAGFAVLTAVGRLSGYRPFRWRWSGSRVAEVETLSMRLRLAAEAHGFKTVWCAPFDSAFDGGHEFIAVGGLELEPPGPTGDARLSMRISLSLTQTLIGDVDAVLTVAKRGLVLWDTGERRQCEAIGEAIVAAAVAGT